MIIGKGVIANRFVDYSLQSSCFLFIGEMNDLTIENSMVFDDEEKDLKLALLENAEAVFVYFSSCYILDEGGENGECYQHKLRMEQMVQKNAKHFLIVRLPDVFGVGGEVSLTALNVFDAINDGKEFDILEHEYKNIIDVDDVYDIVGELLKQKVCLNEIVNVASLCQTPVLKIVQLIENFIDKKAKYKLLSEGEKCDVDVSRIKPIVNDLEIEFNDTYFERILEKYYSHFIAPPQVISIIVPTYNEEHGINEFYRRTKNVLAAIAPRFEHEIIFVNDFSTDSTYKKLQQISKNDPDVKLVNFSRNFGNQIGITAGIDYSQGDLAVVIDDDLQDPPEVILNLIAKWDKGYKVVYGVRPRREGVNPFFKIAAKFYYRLIGSLSDTEIPNDTGDFRLMDKVVIDTLKDIKEENRYYRGLVAWVGFSQTGVVYDRDKRYAGESTFSFKKYVNFAVNGLTSFTHYINSFKST